MAIDKAAFQATCRALLDGYRSGKLGDTRMPEDSNPGFAEDEHEMRLAYFTLPMALNYQRDSYKLWEAAKRTYEDPETRVVFDIVRASELPTDELRAHLTKHKLALQPNKHVATWQTIARTTHENWGSLRRLMEASDGDFLMLRELVQSKHKRGFPYISGPKIFNYWSFILGEYGNVVLRNCEHIEIAPDTHVFQCSIRLGVITETESETLTRDAVSARWREALDGSGITPIEMHPPLWFWSRSGFAFTPK